MHGNLFVTDIDHENRVRQAAMLLTPPRLRSSFSARARALQNFLLGQTRESTVFLHRVEIFEALDRLLDGLEVGERAAQPAVADIGHAAADRLGLDRITGRTLGADEQHLATVGRERS
jgi:hypothetical protein